MDLQFGSKLAWIGVVSVPIDPSRSLTLKGGELGGGWRGLGSRKVSVEGLVDEDPPVAETVAEGREGGKGELRAQEMGPGRQRQAGEGTALCPR